MAVLKMGEMNIRQETEADHPSLFRYLRTRTGAAGRNVSAGVVAMACRQVCGAARQ